MSNNKFVYGSFKILLLFAMLTLLSTCDRDESQEKDCIILSRKDCSRLKIMGIDESYSFLTDLTWTKSNSYEEKLQACQIPDSILSEMCTYDLVKTCLVNYPFISDLSTINNIQDGFKRYKGAFNGIQKLIKRCDCCIEIIDHYKKLSLSINPDSIFTFKSSWGLYFTEIFLAQPDFFRSLTNYERISLFKLALKVRELKLNDDRHGFGSIDATDWILARIMVFESYTPFIKRIKENESLSRFVESMQPIKQEDFVEIDTLIYNYSISFLKSKE